jgi:pimeloyl-ACP methyl ester carboxylesterase
MRVVLITLLIIGIQQQAHSQRNGSEQRTQDTEAIIQKALERYPVLELCQPPGNHEQVLCGQFMAFENYDTQKGKKIPIDVMVLPATTENPDNSAFTLHWGGNGAAASDKIWYFRQRDPTQTIRATRDVVMIDDRGTGASNIRCDAMDSLKPYSYAFAYDESRIKECLAQVKEKVDLSLYTTPYVVQDYEEVRKWLGLDRYDFYGTRVGLEYMRLYPDNIRTLTVKGLVPPGFNYINEMDAAIQKQLENLFERCEKDTACSKYYPDFENELYAVRDQLKKEPVEINYTLEDGESTTFTMDDLLFRRMIGHQILNGDKNEALPLMVHHAYSGNYTPLIVAGGSLNLDMPVFLSQFCPEEVDRFPFDPEGFEANELFTQGAIGQEKISACQWWTEMPAAKWLDEPLAGDNPILILTGEYDANTPIKMGEQVKEAFPDQSRHITLPHNGHAGTTDQACRFDIISQFIETKDLQGLDTTCLSEIESAPIVYELPLSEEEYKNYAGEYSSEDPEKILKLFKQNGVFYLVDEYTQFSGPSQLLYKGDHTFGLLDCAYCEIIFEMDREKVSQAQRDYRETITFKPKRVGKKQ